MDTNNDVDGNPDFAVVWSFFKKFGKQLELEDVMITDVLKWITSETDQASSVVEVMVKLMRKIGMRVDKQRWQKHLVRAAAKFDLAIAAEVEDAGFHALSVPKKLRLLKLLCEMQFDDNMKFKSVINNEDPEEQRLKPVGRDEDGLVYWHQEDEELNIRVYVEDEDEDEDLGWKVVCRSKEEIQKLIKKLANEPGDKSKDDNSDEEELVETKFQLFLRTQCTSESHDDNDGAEKVYEDKNPTVFQDEAFPKEEQKSALVGTNENKDSFSTQGVSKEGTSNISNSLLEAECPIDKQKCDGTSSKNCSDEEAQKNAEDGSKTDTLEEVKKEALESGIDDKVCENVNATKLDNNNLAGLDNDASKSSSQLTVKVEPLQEDEKLNESTGQGEATETNTENVVLDGVSQSDLQTNSPLVVKTEPPTETGSLDANSGKADSIQYVPQSDPAGPVCSMEQSTSNNQSAIVTNDSNDQIQLKGEPLQGTSDKASESTEVRGEDELKNEAIQPCKDTSEGDPSRCTNSDKAVVDSVGISEKSSCDGDSTQNTSVIKPDPTCSKMDEIHPSVELAVEPSVSETTSTCDETKTDVTPQTNEKSIADCIEGTIDPLPKPKTEPGDDESIIPATNTEVDSVATSKSSTDNISSLSVDETAAVVPTMSEKNSDICGDAINVSHLDQADNRDLLSDQTQVLNSDLSSSVSKGGQISETHDKPKDTETLDKKLIPSEQSELVSEVQDSKTVMPDELSVGKLSESNDNLLTKFADQHLVSKTADIDSKPSESGECPDSSEQWSELSGGQGANKEAALTSNISQENADIMLQSIDINSKRDDNICQSEMASLKSSETSPTRSKELTTRDALHDTKSENTECINTLAENNDTKLDDENAAEKLDDNAPVCNGDKTVESSSAGVIDRPEKQDAEEEEEIEKEETKKPAGKRKGKRRRRRPACSRKRPQSTEKKTTGKTPRKKKPKLSRLELLRVEAESILHISEKKSNQGNETYRTRSGRRVKSAKKDEEPEVWQTLGEDDLSGKLKGMEVDEDFEYVEKEKKRSRTNTPVKEKPVKEVKRIVNDDTPCMKCGLFSHPETILLCDCCDKGHHMACLTPPLMIVPDEEWFCPKCSKEKLIVKLKEIYKEFETKEKLQVRKTRQNEYKKLLNDYTGISATNIIPNPTKPEKPKPASKRRRNSFSPSDSESAISDDEVGSLTVSSPDPPSSPEVKPQRRCRKKVSYDFSTFDKTIMDAIGEDIQKKPEKDADDRPVSGKDIRTIIAAEKGKDADDFIKDKDDVGFGKRKKRNLTNLNSSDEAESGSNYSLSQSEEELSEEEFIASSGSESEEMLLSGRQARCRPGRSTRAKPHIKPKKRSKRLRRKRILADYEIGIDASSSDYEEEPVLKKKKKKWADYGRESSEDEYIPPRRERRFINDDDDDDEEQQEGKKQETKRTKRQRIVESSDAEDPEKMEAAVRVENGKKEDEVSSDDWSSLSSNAAQSSEEGSLSESDTSKPGATATT